MRCSVCAFALVALLVVGGCKKGPDIVGKWSATAGDKSVEIEFTADGAYSIGTSRLKAKGEYKLEGDKLSLTPKDLEIPGAKADDLAKVKASPNFQTTTDATIRLNGPDELAITGLPGAKNPATGTSPTIVLKRVKS